MKRINYNTKYWKNYKLNIPELNINLFSVLLGTLLGDSCLYKRGENANVKFEQSYNHKDYLFHLYDLFKIYTFSEPYIRKNQDGSIKSYSFRTFTHPTFNIFYNLFYILNNENENKRKKSITLENIKLIIEYMNPIVLSYWIMDDGSLDKNKKMMTIHSQSFSYEINSLLSEGINKKFNLNSEVIIHKDKYYVIRIPSKNHKILHNLIKPHLHNSMLYKLPIN
jgi:hypothetical protein